MTDPAPDDSAPRVPPSRPRARSIGIAPGGLSPGPLNAITDVAGVAVGHVTLHRGRDVRTGVTAVLPHPGNLFQHKVPAGFAAGNGFGKFVGSTQIVELGELEAPIVLTNTLSIAAGIAAAIDWTLSQSGNEEVMSVNAVVGETNDGYLSDIRGQHVTRQDVLKAITQATGGPVPEGCVGAGTGTRAFDWKGGIGTSSRRLPPTAGGFDLGVLVQTNYGGRLSILGAPVERRPDKADEPPRGDGSVVIVVATDAPLSDRNLARLARRALLGIARTGSWMANGSGDYALAFSTAEAVRRPHGATTICTRADWPNAAMSPLFQAAVEATEEAVLNAMLQAVTTKGFRGRRLEALSPAVVEAALARHRGGSRLA